MADLIAQGLNPEDRWRRQLLEEDLLVVGRRGTGMSVPWDDKISRQHVRIRLREGRLKVDRIADAKNPVFYRGHQLDSFWLSPGEHFVIGHTRFSLVADRVFVSVKDRQPDRQQSFKREYLREIRYRDADQRVAVLNQLPDIVSQAGNEDDLLMRLTTVLLTGIRRASTAAIVEFDSGLGEAGCNVLHWDRRLLSGGDFKPSLTLIRQAIETGESFLHIWDDPETGPDVGGSDLTAQDITMHSEGNWAFVIPLSSNIRPPRAVYVAGDTATTTDSEPPFDAADLRDDMKFAELVGATLANLLHMRRLERNQASLRSFFSPVVLEAIANQNFDEVLKPRECDVSVLFCDLRGFSKTSEEYSDQLYELLDRVSNALGVSTSHILKERGVVGDFHGDAAMGFWGWPLEQPDSIERACRAAIKIQRHFREKNHFSANPLRDFQFGMGIATGRAVAGRIGSADQVKVTAFGPVVNLAARLESMTRQLNASILIHETTADVLRKQAFGADFRVRRLACIRPYGMTQAFMVNQLMDNTEPDALTGEQIEAYEAALDLFIAGDWSQAFNLLHQVPASDRAKDLLTVYIAQHNRSAPADWNGVIEIQQK